jgi:hypothetical protein
VFGSDAATPSQRWGAILGLQGLLASHEQWSDVLELLQSDAGRALGGPYLLLLNVAAGAPFAASADSVAATLRPTLDRLGTPTLWLVGLWSAARQRLDDLAAARDAALAWAGRTGSRRDRLIADVLDAHFLVASGDSAGGMVRLEGLRANARRDELLWQPWESLAPERMLLAALYLERGRYQDAYRVASFLDHPQPIIYLLFRRQSLLVREAAAERLGRPDLARRHHSQLMELSSSL